MGDIIRPGAFAETIREWRAKAAKVPVVFSHQSDDPTKYISEVDPAQLEETPIGLEARGILYLDEPTAQKVHRQLVRKTLTAWSFGYIVRQAKRLAEGSREMLRVQPTICGAGTTATLDIKTDRLSIDEARQTLTRVQLAPLRAQWEIARRSAALNAAQ
jgi:HK97 family phage prohead protease